MSGAGARASSNLLRIDALPISVETCDAPGSGTLLRWNTDNLELLHAVAACEEVVREAREDHSALALEVARVDARLRLVLRLLARLAASTVPPVREIRLGAAQVEWEAMSPGAPGTHAVASIWLTPQVPEPLRLPGRLATAPPGPGGRSWVQLVYEGVSAPVVEALERHIFLHHRRAIALARPVGQQS